MTEYRRRVLARICVNCQAGLQENDDKRCVECQEQRDITVERYEAANRAKRVAYASAYKKAHRIAVRAADRKRRRLKIERGQCINCKKKRLADSQYCEMHRDRHRAASLKYARTKASQQAKAVA